MASSPKGKRRHPVTIKKNITKQRKKNTPKHYILVADVGGTNTNFALLEEKPGCNTKTEKCPIKTKLLLSLDYNSQELTNFTKTVNEVLLHIKRDYNIIPKTACFAVAGPINLDGSYGYPTKLPWIIGRHEIVKRTPLKSVAIINDFQAVAFGIEALKPTQLKKIKPGHQLPQAPRAVLGAGTGLGKSILFHDTHLQRHLPIPSEGGHANCPVTSEEEFRLLQYIQQLHNNPTVSWDNLLSGQGIQNIYRYLYSIKKFPETKYTREINHSGFSTVLISQYRTKDKLCKATFDLFVRFYARCAKCLALESLPFNGLYIAGGIAAKNIGVFNKDFIKEFLTTEKQEEILKQIPIHLVTDYDVSLYGAAIAAILHRDGHL